jgi:peptidoglycan/LPS O-acetylase OafA/YrhL
MPPTLVAEIVPVPQGLPGHHAGTGIKSEPRIESAHTPQRAPAPPSRLMQVDVLRGAAIFLVLFRHAVISSELAGPLKPVVRRLYYFSATGIDLFFVLSGFLIGGLLFKELRNTGGLDVRRFLIRRCLRIWPGYYVFIAFVFLRGWHARGHTAKAAFLAILPNLLHLQNYLGSARGITWSLAAQEHFYLALPLFLLLMMRRRNGLASLAVIPWIAVGLILICTAMRVLLNWNRPYDLWTHVAPTHLRLDSLFFGVLIAYFYQLKHPLLARVGRHRSILLLLGIAMIAPTIVFDEGSIPFTWTLSYTLLYLGYGCILVAFIFSTPDRGLLGRALASRPAAALAGIGVFTYSIYLWHYDLGALPVHNYLLAHLPRHPAPLYWLIGTAAYLAAALSAGIIMARLIEMPVIRLRDRIAPSRASLNASPPSRPPAPCDSSGNVRRDDPPAATSGLLNPGGAWRSSAR